MSTIIYIIFLLHIMATSAEKLSALGERYELSGKQLLEWVSDQQKLERADREATRTAEKEKEEAEQRKLDTTLEIERLALQKVQIQKEVRSVTAERRLHGIRINQKEEAACIADNESHDDETSSTHGDQYGMLFAKRGPKIPAFDEDKDDLDSYLFRFERYASLQSWRKKTGQYICPLY